MACKWPLQDFLLKISTFEDSLGAFAKYNHFRTGGQSARWSVLFTDEVERIRALVAAKHISINLLLAMKSSYVLQLQISFLYERFTNALLQASYNQYEESR